VANKVGVGGVSLVLPTVADNFIEEEHTWSVDLLVESNKVIFPFMLPSPLGFYIVDSLFFLKLL
jgi:hypothetical protein